MKIYTVMRYANDRKELTCTIFKSFSNVDEAKEYAKFLVVSHQYEDYKNYRLFNSDSIPSIEEFKTRPEAQVYEFTKDDWRLVDSWDNYMHQEKSIVDINNPNKFAPNTEEVALFVNEDPQNAHGGYNYSVVMNELL